LEVFDLLNSALVVAIPWLTDMYLWTGSIMVGNLVIWGEHWGKLPWSERFQSPLRLFAGLLGIVILGLVITRFTSPLIENWLSSNVNYLTGTTSGVIGAFYVWFILSGDWSLRTDYKWVPPIVLFGTTILNFLFYHPENLPFSTSWISVAFVAMILIPILFLIFARSEDSELWP